MVTDGYGNEVKLGDDVLVRCRVVGMRAGTDPLMRLQVYGTYCRSEVGRKRDATGMQYIMVQASACGVVQETVVAAVQKPAVKVVSRRKALKRKGKRCKSSSGTRSG